MTKHQNKIKNLLYVPFQRVMEKKAGVASGAGQLQAGKLEDDEVRTIDREEADEE